MTGFEEAAIWLAAHAPKWRIKSGRSHLIAGESEGAPTRRVYDVVLGANSLDPQFQLEFDTETYGEGGSFLEAVQSAIGGLAQ